MKFSNRFLIIIQIIYKIFLLIAITFPFKVKAQNNVINNKTYAIVIGISQYQNTSIPALSYADKDAGLFAAWLKNDQAIHLDENNLKLFLNENATIANIYASFNWLKKQVSENDQVYIYFSGHGDIETDNQTSKGYLLAWNSPSNNYVNNAISVADLNELANSLTTVNKANVILITDACHSGKMAGDFYKGRELTANNLRLVLNNQVRLASCQANELAAEGPGWGGGRGVFSYYLLKGLEGFAKADSSNKIRVENLEGYLDSSFKEDEGLKIERHIQHPVIDGSPIFPLALFDSANYLAAKNDRTVLQQPIRVENTGLQSLNSLGEQPIDYFFSILNKGDLDSMLDYKNYINLSLTEIPLKLVSDYLEKLKYLRKIFEGIHDENIEKYTEQMHIQMDERDEKIIRTLQNQLSDNQYLIKRFNENLVQSVHKKCQVLINAYLSGDLDELEKRQYYNTGKKPYGNFLSLMQVAISITPEDHYLYKILNINKHYLSGLEQRMQMAISKTGSDSLLQKAFVEQRQALQLEPYAAYIHNELGNLYMQKKNVDSALYYFNYASALAPTWAIPWSNKIRVYFALQKPKEAYTAVHIADSLQPALSFVKVNAGLVMEKDSNWLAAESYYLNAIAQNNMHYLPYERLGFVYLNTGDYAKSEEYFIEADQRKNQYAVNDKVFDFGVEAGGITGMPSTREKENCHSLEEDKINGWSNFIKLGKILSAIDTLNNIDSKEMIALEALVQNVPQLPFAAHYLGKKYFTLNSLAQAEKVLKQAIQNQIPPDQLKQTLIFQLKNALDKHLSNIENDSLIDHSCILKTLLNLEYDYLEDYYMLANIYEQRENLSEAITLYKKISEIENKRLLDQANYLDYKKRDRPENYEEQIYKYELPIKMGGALKLAGLYEQLQKYDSSEFILLDQVKKDRKAGFARQAQINLGNRGATKSTVNLFWLMANEDLEAATYNFYARRLAQSPREAEWYKKAGLFLLERLALTYNQIPLPEQKYFYRYSLKYPYPYRGGEEDQEATPEAIKERLNITNEFEIPVTHEKIKIDMKVYDPVKSAIYFLQKAIKYSGEMNPEAKLLLSQAHLFSWMGNTAEAINYFEMYLVQKPEDLMVRNKFINYLNAIHQFVAESVQLTILNNNNHLNNDQVIKLAGYKVLSNEPKEAKQLLTHYIPQNLEDKNVVNNWRIQILIKEEKYSKAISLLKDSLSFKNNKTEQKNMEPEEQLLENEKYFSSVYSQARLYALLKQNKKVLILIDDILKSGFKYDAILKHDPLLKNIRKEKQWKNIFSKYQFSENAIPEIGPTQNFWRSSLEYRIPKKK